MVGKSRLTYSRLFRRFSRDEIEEAPLSCPHEPLKWAVKALSTVIKETYKLYPMLTLR